MKLSLLSVLLVAALVGCNSTGTKETQQPQQAKPVAASSHGPAWKLSVQAWTFNSLTFCDAVDRTATLGVKYIEAFPGQKVGGGMEGGMGPDLDAATRQKVLDKLKASGVTLINFGVTGAGDEAGWRKLFDFAKAMGIQTIVSEPGEEQMSMLSKLCDEYGINIAIHDHPKPSHYWNPDILLAAIQGQSKRIGACADVGHWVRSGLDPIDCLRKLEGHIISLHFKDLSVKGSGHDVPWGTGVSNIAGQFAELKRQNFKGVFSIEYEHNTPELMSNCERCVAFFRECEHMSAQDLLAGHALLPGFTMDPKNVWKNVIANGSGKW